MRILISLIFTLSSLIGIGQVNIISGQYFQDFGNVPITTWVNNVTFQGWYSSIPLTNYVPCSSGNQLPNPAGFYTYSCNSTDQKIGGRPSGSIPRLRIGILLRNMSGSPIYSLQISYTGYQMSQACNGIDPKKMDFSYIMSQSPSDPITSISTNSNLPPTTPYPQLTLMQFSSSSCTSTTQQSPFCCLISKFGTFSSCLQLQTPLNNGEYIALRWEYVDWVQNEHHLALDNVKINFGISSESPCGILLPVELVSFLGELRGDEVKLTWQTASESNSSHFEVERSNDIQKWEKIGSVASAGDSQSLINYNFFDKKFGSGQVIYYRLKQVDRDGQFEYSNIVSIDQKNAQIWIRDGHIHYSGENPEEVQIWDMWGRFLGNLSGGQKQLDVGIYFVNVAGKVHKIAIN